MAHRPALRPTPVISDRKWGQTLFPDENSVCPHSFDTLVSYDDEGRPYTVRYLLLTPMLLNEVQRQDQELRELRTVADEVADLREIVADQQRRPDKLARKKWFREG